MKVCVFVLVPSDAPNFSKAVDALMERYNWNREVEPYQTECWCIESRAESEVFDRVRARFGTIPELEAQLSNRGLTREQDDRFEELVEKQGRNNWKSTNRLTEAEQEELAELSKLIEDPSMAAFRIWNTEGHKERTQNPPVLRPKADCEECGGSGVMTTTDNPNGQFESQLLCYDLEVPRYDPALDVNLRLPCANPPDKSCALEEQPEEVTLRNFLSLPARTFRAARAALRIASPASCEGCLGYAERLRWAQDWKENRNSMLPVSWLDECSIFPYAIVSPDGEWHDLDVLEHNGATTERAWSESVAKFERLMEENASCYVGACYVRM